jgi:hypothetical protein
VQTYPELNATNSSEWHTGRWMSPILGESHFDLAYLAMALAAMTDPRQYMNTVQAKIYVNRLRSDTGALEELYAFDASPDLDALAVAQGVQPIENIDDLVANFWPEGESVEDFIAAAMEGRHEEEDSSY